MGLLVEKAQAWIVPPGWLSTGSLPPAIMPAIAGKGKLEIRLTRLTNPTSTGELLMLGIPIGKTKT